MKNAMLVFLLLMGSLNAGETETTCEKTFSRFLQTLKERPDKLDFFFYEPIGKDLVRMQGCRDYQKMNPQETALWRIKLRELFDNSTVQKVQILEQKDYTIHALVILKKKDRLTKHESVFIRDGWDIAIYCKEPPVPCDEDGN